MGSTSRAEVFRSQFQGTPRSHGASAIPVAGVSVRARHVARPSAREAATALHARLAATFLLDGDKMTIAEVRAVLKARPEWAAIERRQRRHFRAFEKIRAEQDADWAVLAADHAELEAAGQLETPEGQYLAAALELIDLARAVRDEVEVEQAR
jgi:hypothetical protein